MKIDKFFWSISEQALKETKEILKNPEHPRYVQKVYAILSRTDKTKEVFKIIPKKDFIANWRKIKKYWSKRNQSSDFLSWWSAIYDTLIENDRPEPAPSKVMKNIASLLKNARIEKDWTQSDLASRVNINQAYISKIENGRAVNLQTSTLIKICRALDIKNIPVS